MPLTGTLDLGYSIKTRVSVCAQCKKRFGHTVQHMYTRTEAGKKLYYCSYTCYRVKGKEDEERAREEFRNACQFLERRAAQKAKYQKKLAEMKASGKSEYPVLLTKQDALQYLDHAKRKLSMYSAEWLDTEPGTRARDNARRNVTKWERRIVYAKNQAEILPEE